MSLTVHETGSAHPRAWTTVERVLFRFAFCYWILYFLPSSGSASLLDLLPYGGEKLSTWLGWPLAKLSHVVGVHLLHLHGEAADWHPTGSGDTAMNYMMLLCVLFLAVVVTAVWSAVAETRGKRNEYTNAYAFLRLFLRFTLAVTLFGYGFAKVFPGQFGYEPSLFQLNERWGREFAHARVVDVYGGVAAIHHFRWAS